MFDLTKSHKNCNKLPKKLLQKIDFYNPHVTVQINVSKSLVKQNLSMLAKRYCQHASTDILF